MHYTPGTEISDRIQRVQSLMADSTLDGLLVVHHTNLFYFSGTSQNGFLFIPRTGAPLLMVKKSYERAIEESAISDIVPLKSMKEVTSLIRSHTGTLPVEIGLELDIIPFNTVQFYEKRVLPGILVKDAAALFAQVRLIKSEYEIQLLKHACKVLDQAFAAVGSFLRQGMKEIELAARFESFLRQNGYGGGCKVRAFNRDFMYGNIVSGKSGKVPSYFDGPVNGSGVTPANNPHGAGWKRIEKNEPVYIDYTCVINGYTADAQRVFVLGGALPDNLVRAHQVALTIQEKIEQALCPGAKCSDMWGIAVKIAEQENLVNHFMGFGPDRVRFVGHGVGLELDEMPVFADGFDISLEKGMTFALEPKFVFDNGAVGIENTFALNGSRAEKLNSYGEEIHYL